MAGRVRDGALVVLALVVATLAAMSLRTVPAPTPPVAVTAIAATVPAAPVARPLPVQPRLVRPSHGRPRPVVLFVGDSYVGGGQTGYAALLGKRFGWDISRRSSAGGGYLKKGLAGTVSDLLRSSGGLAPDLIVLQAGHNDVIPDAPQLPAAVQVAVATARSTARVVVVGVLWPTAPPEPHASAVNEVLRAAAAGAFTPTLDLRFPADARNRPTEEGHRLIAARLAASFQQLGLVA